MVYTSPLWLIPALLAWLPLRKRKPILSDATVSRVFERVSYASEREINSPWWCGGEQTSLEVTATEIRFAERTNIRSADIQVIRFVREPLHWGALLLGVSLFTVFVFVIRGDLAILIRGFGLGLPIYALVALKNKWVLVNHCGNKTYFKIWRGGTKNLYLELQQRYGLKSDLDNKISQASSGAVKVLDGINRVNDVNTLNPNEVSQNSGEKSLLEAAYAQRKEQSGTEEHGSSGLTKTKIAPVATRKVKCPGCGAENSPDDNFCGDCGAALPKVNQPAE